MRSSFKALSILILVSLIAWITPAAAQGQSAPAASGALEAAIGKVLTVEGTATIQHTAAVVVQASAPSGPVTAKVGDLVYTGDIVQTGADGKVGLVFADGTALNVLTNARMELNEFVYHPNSSVSSSVFSLVRGSLTYVGGKMAKTGRVRVDTPTATLGIRGTTAHVVIAPDGSVRFSTLVEEKN
jgi:hypothetical protein